MSPQSFRLSIVIPTKNRVKILTQLLESITQLDGVSEIRPEVLVADNASDDGTGVYVDSIASTFPVAVRTLKVTRPGKSAALNDAFRSATGDVLACLDDDVVADRTWLTALHSFLESSPCQAGQGLIRLQSPARDDPEVITLVQRFRTIPNLEYKPEVKKVHSLNGANFFVSRDAFDRVGGFDERLGPGASGTSEDVDFARRLTRANIAIGYAPEAIVYHRVDRHRLTEEYFKASHRRQGASRFLIRRQSTATIYFNLARAVAQYGYYAVRGGERDLYRSKGRIYHYLGMIEAKQKPIERRQADKASAAIESRSARR